LQDNYNKYIFEPTEKQAILEDKIRAIIIIIEFFIVFTIFPENYINQNINSVNEKNISGMIAPGILFSIKNTGINEFKMSYITGDKSIIYRNMTFNGDFKLKNEGIVYQYEKEDIVTFLEIFSYGGRQFIVHLEKFSYEIIMNYFSDTNEIGKIKLGETDMKPFIFLKNGSLSIFYHDVRSNTLIHKEFELDTFKFRQINGLKDIDEFSIQSDETSGNFLALWKYKNEYKNIYLSVMDAKFNGLSNIIQLKFKQNMPVPLNSISNRQISLIFVNDFQNSFLKFPYTDDIRNYSTEIFPDIFKDYGMIDYLQNFGMNMIVFKKSIIENDKKYDDLLVGIFDGGFNLKKQLKPDNVSGIVQSTKCFIIDRHLYLFWLEKSGDDRLIKYSIMSL
jgi:hypothetical protein